MRGCKEWCGDNNNDFSLQVVMFGLQDSVSAGLSQVRGPVTALKEEPLATNHALSARSWMQPGIVDTSG